MMNSKTTQIMSAFVMGQVIQVVLAVLAKVSFMSRPILFCIAAGFLILIAVVSGIVLATDTEGQKAQKRQKTYREYAENIDSTE